MTVKNKENTVNKFMLTQQKEKQSRMTQDEQYFCCDPLF